MLLYCMGRETEAIVNQINVRAPRAAVAAKKGMGNRCGESQGC